MTDQEKDSTKPQELLIPHLEMENTFFNILKKYGFKEGQAQSCAHTFMENSLDGVYSHGVNRFPRFVECVKKALFRQMKKQYKREAMEWLNSGMVS